MGSLKTWHFLIRQVVHIFIYIGCKTNDKKVMIKWYKIESRNKINPSVFFSNLWQKMPNCDKIKGINSYGWIEFELATMFLCEKSSVQYIMRCLPPVPVTVKMFLVCTDGERSERAREHIQKLVNSSIIDGIVCFCLAYILIYVYHVVNNIEGLVNRVILLHTSHRLSIHVCVH